MAVTDDPALVVRPDEFAYVGPGTLAGRYLRRFWQPVYLVADLPAGRAVPLHLFGEDFTLYRGEAAPSPLAGRGWEGGEASGADQPVARDEGLPPSLTLPRQGGGNVHVVAFR